MRTTLVLCKFSNTIEAFIRVQLVSAVDIELIIRSNKNNTYCSGRDKKLWYYIEVGHQKFISRSSDGFALKKLV